MGKYLVIMALAIISVVLSIVSIYRPPLAQFGIFLFGMPALGIVGFKEHNIRRWAYVLGCLGQPFWFITAIDNSQWGILSLCFFYTLSWFNGLYQHWIK